MNKHTTDTGALTGYRTPLRAWVGSPLPPAKLEILRRDAWQEQGLLIIDPNDIRHEGARTALIRLAEKLYGRREESLT